MILVLKTFIFTSKSPKKGEVLFRNFSTKFYFSYDRSLKIQHVHSETSYTSWFHSQRTR